MATSTTTLTTAIFLCFLLVATTLRCATMSEIQALTAFKIKLHDPLGALDGWDSSTPAAPCDWHGILCSHDNNRVIELTLTRLQLSGPLSNSLSTLPQLRKLNLHSNNFNGSIPSSLSQCLFLRVIYLHNNSFTGKLPNALLNNANLQALNVAHNFLSGNVPSHVSSSIRFLDLSSNSFSGKVIMF